MKIPNRNRSLRIRNFIAQKGDSRNFTFAILSLQTRPKTIISQFDNLTIHPSPLPIPSILLCPVSEWLPAIGKLQNYCCAWGVQSEANKNVLENSTISHETFADCSENVPNIKVSFPR